MARPQIPNPPIDIGRFASRHISSQLVSIAGPYIDALRDTVEESSMLEVMSGDSVLIAYRASGPHVVNVLVKAGTMIPVHASPGGKAILAFSPPEIVDSILNKKLPRYTSRTITDVKVLQKQFEEIRQKGVAFASGERDEDVNALGAPLFEKDKKAVAALVITMPAFRAKHHNQDTLISLLMETAGQITDQIITYGL